MAPREGREGPGVLPVLVGLPAVDLLYALLFTECLGYKTTQRRKQVVLS